LARGSGFGGGLEDVGGLHGPVTRGRGLRREEIAARIEGVESSGRTPGLSGAYSQLWWLYFDMFLQDGV